MKTYYAVTTSVYNDGRVICNITDKVKAERKPKDTMKELMTKDVYVDWFSSYEKAEEFVQQSRLA